jgi:hypothetical protein
VTIVAAARVGGTRLATAVMEAGPRAMIRAGARRDDVARWWRAGERVAWSSLSLAGS